MSLPDYTSRTPGRAPLRNTDLPPGSIVPGEYLVYLEPGCTIEEHRRTVGADALPEDSIKHAIPLHADGYGLYYTAKLSESGLDKIRLDPRVLLTECKVMGYCWDD